MKQLRILLNTNSLCYKCLGCQKLEDMRFTGVHDCNNYRSMDSNEGFKIAKRTMEQIKMS